MMTTSNKETDEEPRGQPSRLHQHHRALFRIKSNVLLAHHQAPGDGIDEKPTLTTNIPKTLMIEHSLTSSPVGTPK
jgi:hypothetical protein